MRKDTALTESGRTEAEVPDRHGLIGVTVGQARRHGSNLEPEATQSARESAARAESR